MRASIVLLLAVAIAPSPAAAGCTSDHQCKGDRICRDGECAPPGVSCETDQDCPGVAICTAGRCGGGAAPIVPGDPNRYTSFGLSGGVVLPGSGSWGGFESVDWGPGISLRGSAGWMPASSIGLYSVLQYQSSGVDRLGDEADVTEFNFGVGMRAGAPMGRAWLGVALDLLYSAVDISDRPAGATELQLFPHVRFDWRTSERYGLILGAGYEYHPTAGSTGAFAYTLTRPAAYGGVLIHFNAPGS